MWSCVLTALLTIMKSKLMDNDEKVTVKNYFRRVCFLLLHNCEMCINVTVFQNESKT